MERDLKRVAEELKLPQESRERIRLQIASCQGQKEDISMKKTETRKRRFTPRAVAAVAIAAAVLCGSAVAVVSTGLDQQILKLLGAADSEQGETIITGAQVVDQTVTDSGSSLTVQKVLGDKDNIYVLLNFTAPEGTVLDAQNYRFREEDVDFGTPIQEDTGLDAQGDRTQEDTVTVYSPGNWYTLDYTKLEDDDPADNSVDLVMHITADAISHDGTMTLRLSDLEAAPGNGEPFVSLGLPGEWTVSFPLEFTDCSLTWEVEAPVTICGQQTTVTEVTLSPLSVTVKAAGEALGETMDTAQADALGTAAVTLRFRDGATLTASVESGDETSVLVQNGSAYANWKFHQVIDPSQVESILYGDAEIHVAQRQK